VQKQVAGPTELRDTYVEGRNEFTYYAISQPLRKTDSEAALIDILPFSTHKQDNRFFLSYN